MRAAFYEDVNEFYNKAFAFLIINEIKNSLLLTILNSLKMNIQKYGKEPPLMFSLAENSSIKLISLMTPPRDLIISFTDDLNNIKILVEELSKKNVYIPGVLSFKEAADKFAKLWCEKNSLESKLLRRERIYKLTKVSEETLGDSKFSVATKPHQLVVLKWAREMLTEALSEVTEEQLVGNNNNLKDEFEHENSQIYLLFEDSVPVSMARKSGKAPHGYSINLVYTPPSLRRNGYATECVAKLSKLLLEKGNEYCFLFTDLSNPTSNSIYQKIGYHPIIDENHYKFFSKKEKKR